MAYRLRGCPIMRDDLTAVMIVKNEEAHLERCLESVKLATDKMVVVDTGSTDATMEIAHSFGAELHQHPWQDSFSEARNYALKFVKTKWALAIDADEALIEATLGALDKMEDRISAYITPIHNQMPNGSIQLHHFERLYQPANIHYQWRVHNQVTIDKGLTERTNLSFAHYGYAQSEEVMKRKYENTLRLLMMDIEDAGYVPRNVRYLVQTYKSLKRHTDVLDVLDKHLHELLPFPGIYQEVATAAIISHNALGDNEKAKIAGIQLLQKFPEALDALFYLGVCSMLDQAWSVSMEYFAKYVQVRSDLQMQDCDSSVIYHTWGNRAEAFQNIAICASMNGNKAQAALFSMRAEMLASHRSDYPAFAANTDQALCQLIQKEPVATMVTGRKVMNLNEPENGWGKTDSFKTEKIEEENGNRRTKTIKTTWPDLAQKAMAGEDTSIKGN